LAHRPPLAICSAQPVLLADQDEGNDEQHRRHCGDARSESKMNPMTRRAGQPVVVTQWTGS
jgi:hypothetical protein